MHLAVLLWGFTGVLGRAINCDFPVLVWWRMLLTALILVVILFYRKQWIKIAGRDMAIIIAVGCLIGIHWVAFYGAIKFANASIALICLSTASVFTSMIDPLVNKGKYNALELVLGLIALAGVYLIYMGSIEMSAGILLGVIAAILSSIFTMLNKRVAHKYPSRTIVFYEMSFGWILITVCLAVVFLLHAEEYLISPQNVTGSLSFLPVGYDWLWLLVLSLCCTVWAQSLALNALKKLSSFTVTLSVNLEPVYGIILAFIFFPDERDIHQSFYWGMALIMISVGLQMLRVVRPKKPLVEERSGIE